MSFLDSFTKNFVTKAIIGAKIIVNNEKINRLNKNQSKNKNIKIIETASNEINRIKKEIDDFTIVTLDTAPNLRGRVKTNENMIENILKQFKTTTFKKDSLAELAVSLKKVDISNKNKIYILKIKSSFGHIQLIPLNKKKKNEIFEIIKRHVLQEDDDDKPDSEAIYTLSNLRDAKSFQILELSKEDFKLMIEGGFFPYFHSLKGLNLAKFGIFNDQTFIKSLDVNCFIRALIYSGLFNQIEITEMTMSITGSAIPRKNIKKLAEKYDFGISLSTYNDKTKIVKKSYYNKQSKRLLKMCLRNNHYFLDTNVPITSYAIKHAEELHQLEDWTSIVSGKLNGKHRRSFKKRDKGIKINTVITHMFDNNLFTEIDIGNGLLNSQFSKNNNIINKLYSNAFSEYKYKKKHFKTLKVEGMYGTSEVSKYKKIVFFDFETYVSEENQVHIPYLCCKYEFDCTHLDGNMEIDESSGKMNYYFGKNCGAEFLRDIDENSILYAHNLKYDINFIAKYIFFKNYLGDKSKIYSFEGTFYNKHNKQISILGKDSYKIISQKLSNFGKIFNLKQGKEIMPYHIYNRFNIQRQFVPLDEIQMDNKEQFVENVIKWDLLKDDKVDILKYSLKYCLIDCEVLAKGFLKFRKWMKEITDLDTIYYVSIPSIVFDYGLKEGIFDGCNKLSNTEQHFIQRSIVGGRCLLANNQKRHVFGEIQDLDGVSLYPSAIKEMPGFLMGASKVFENMPHKELMEKDGFFIETKVVSVGKNRSFPLLSYKNDKGVLHYCNEEMIGKTIYLNKFSYEDAINFQDIKFSKENRGYYYDSGRNIKCQEFITHLFEERLAKKKAKNPIQSVYKLLMNSLYGKTITKPVYYEFKFVKKDEWKKTYAKYHNYIDSVVDFGGKQKLFKLRKPIHEHVSLPQVGSEILSFSKRIMNRVICLAEDLDIPVYYQDTDSMQIVNKEIPRLCKQFKEKYDLELEGNNLGQFNCDFDFKSDKLPVCIEAYYLAKKIYYCKVKTVINEETIYHEHCRMKGVTTKCITEHKTLSTHNIYSKLYDGEELSFNLSECKVIFKQNDNFTISSVFDFIRNIKI